MRIKLGCLILLVLATTGCSNKEQAVIYEVNSISYTSGEGWATPLMSEECRLLSKELKTYLNDGWKVVTSSPKEKVVYHNLGRCVGTEYVLEKYVALNWIEESKKILDETF